jgi:hypothetical protein
MASKSLEETLRYLEGAISSAKDALGEVIAGLKDVVLPEGLDARTLGEPYGACKDFVAKLTTVDNRAKEAIRLGLECQYNVYWSGKLHRKFDLTDYEAKRAVVKEINEDLRFHGYAIAHPETGAATTLLASSSQDGKGRYVLCDRVTKKRSHTSMTLLDLLPLRLVLEPKRREGLIETRRAKQKPA